MSEPTTAEAREVLAKMTPGEWWDDDQSRSVIGSHSGWILETEWVGPNWDDDKRGIMYLKNHAESWLSRIDALEAEVAAERAKNQAFHRRVQQAEAEAERKHDDIKKRIVSYEFSMRFAQEWFDQHGLDWVHSSNVQRNHVRNLLVERDEARAEVARLTADKERT